MAKKISASEESNDFGQQVFAFGLPNGRTLRLEFCPHLIDPEGGACCAVASLRDEQGQRIGLAVNDLLENTEKRVMQAANLWFSTSFEDEINSRLVRQELGAIKEQLPPLLEATEKGRDKPEE